jgi:hypothetical protein
VAYLPKTNPVRLYNTNNYPSEAAWFNPVSGKITKGKVAAKNGVLDIALPSRDSD